VSGKNTFVQTYSFYLCDLPQHPLGVLAPQVKKPWLMQLTFYMLGLQPFYYIGQNRDIAFINILIVT